MCVCLCVGSDWQLVSPLLCSCSCPVLMGWQWEALMEISIMPHTRCYTCWISKPTWLSYTVPKQKQKCTGHREHQTDFLDWLRARCKPKLRKHICWASLSAWFPQRNLRLPWCFHTQGFSHETSWLFLNRPKVAFNKSNMRWSFCCAGLFGVHGRHWIKYATCCLYALITSTNQRHRRRCSKMKQQLSFQSQMAGETFR